MCHIFAGPCSLCGIPCDIAHLVLACLTFGLSGLRWGGGLDGDCFMGGMGLRLDRC